MKKAAKKVTKKIETITLENNKSSDDEQYLKREKLPEFLKESPILDDLEDEKGHIIVGLKNFKKNTKINNINDYIDLLDTISYFHVKIPKDIEKFEKNEENENMILLELLKRKDTDFYNQKLEDFKFFISNRNCSAIILYRISGTDPTKETGVEVFKVKKNKVDIEIKQIIKNLYKEFLIDMEEESNLSDFYRNILKTIKSKNIDIENLPYELIYSHANHSIPTEGYNLKREISQLFETEPDGFLVALDYYSGYDFHYYIEIKEDFNDKLDIFVHAH